MLPDKTKPAQPSRAAPVSCAGFLRQFLAPVSRREDRRSRPVALVDEAGARRLLQRRGERLILAARGAGELRQLLQVVFGLLAVALFELPQSVILPGTHMVRIGLERALVPDLRHLVVAELAIGVADQISHVGTVVL